MTTRTRDRPLVQASAPPDVATLLTKGDVEAALIWEPTVTQLTESGAGAVIATQQQLQFNREHGTILQSDFWTQDQGEPRSDMFVRQG